MQSKKILTIITALILILPVISAYGAGWGSYRSPIDYLENEWVLFTVLFLIFLAVIFYTINRAFKNKAVAIIIAIGVSLLISLAIAQRGLITIYGGGEVSSWALFIATIIGIGLLIKFASQSFGRIGTIITVFIIWLILHNLNTYDLFPELLANIEPFMLLYNFIINPAGLILLIIIAFYLGGSGPKTFGENIIDLFKKRGR